MSNKKSNYYIEIKNYEKSVRGKYSKIRPAKYLKGKIVKSTEKTKIKKIRKTYK